MTLDNIPFSYRSPRDNIALREMTLYLSDKANIAECRTSNGSEHTIEDLCSGVAERLSIQPAYASPQEVFVGAADEAGDGVGSQSAVKSCANTTQTQKRLPAAQFHLIDFLTDFCGVVREKSQFRIYPNVCYALNKDSKRVILNIMPHNRRVRS